MLLYIFIVFFFKQKTAYEMRISDWSSDVCSSDLEGFVLFMASPVRALADFIYSRKRVWTSVDDLEEDLRIDRENFTESDLMLMKEIGRASCRERVCQYV